MKIDKITAPWTAEQIENLNSWQHAGWVHPFTCGSGRRTNAKHLDGEGVLVATKSGWVCPYCDYRQNWAHTGMAKGKLKPKTPDELIEYLEKLSGRHATDGPAAERASRSS